MHTFRHYHRETMYFLNKTEYFNILYQHHNRRDSLRKKNIPKRTATTRRRKIFHEKLCYFNKAANFADKRKNTSGGQPQQA